MMAAGFIADDLKHKYSFDGRPIVSITDTLADQGFSDYDFLKPHDSEFYLLRGKYIAKACYLFSAGTLAWDSLTATVDWTWEYRGERFIETRPWTLPYVQSYAEAATMYRIKPLVIEKAFYDPLYGYAGRPDMLADSSFGPGVFQLKSGGVEDWVALQTAAELRLFEVNGELRPKDGTKRWGLELLVTGARAKPREFDDRNDIGVFLSALAVSKWQRIHGGKKDGRNKKGNSNERNGGNGGG